MVKYIGIGSLISALVGVGLSFSGWPWVFVVAKVTSGAFINVLKFISLPVIFFSLSATIAKLQSRHIAGQLLSRTLRLTFLTTFIAAFIAGALYELIQPAVGMVKMGVVHHSPVFDFSIDQLVPDNLFMMFAQHNIVAIVLFALLVGVVVTKLPDVERDFMSLALNSIYALFLKMAQLIILLLPLVVWSFVLGLLQQEGAYDTIWLLAGYLSCVFGANIIQGLFILPMLLFLYRIHVVPLFSAVSPALMMAALTKSSTASLPLTLSCIEERTNISNEKANMILPLCATVNMNGCAAFIYITVLFVAQVNGVDFSVGEKLLWVVLSVFAAFGNAGVPMGCFFMSSAYLVSMNISTDMMGVILPFYALIDMVETPINIWSDVSVLSIIDRQDSAK
jgi:Na+/H+-dicarboxylate symporter